jgi:hypothetical protein
MGLEIMNDRPAELLLTISKHRIVSQLWQMAAEKSNPRSEFEICLFPEMRRFAATFQHQLSGGLGE